MKDRTYNLLFLAVALISFFLVFQSIDSVKFYPQADEGYYFGYASYIAEKGFSGFSFLCKEYIKNKEGWLQGPDPLRIGSIFLGALFVKIFGVNFLSLSYLSLLSFFFLLLFWFYFISKYFDKKIAFFSGVLLAFSPLDMGIAQRALIDSTTSLFSILSIFLFFDYLEKRGKIRYITFILVYSYAILVKQISLFLVSPFFLYLCIRFFQSRIFRLRELFLLIIPPLIVLVVWIISVGLFCTIEIIKIYLFYPNPNPSYGILFCSGPWFKPILDFLLVSPIVTILFIGYIFSFKFKKEEVYFLIITISSIFLFYFFQKIIRYVMFLDGPIRLGSILMLNRIFEGKLSFLLWIIIVVIGILDLLSFFHLFVRGGIYDPVSFWLLKIWHIIP
jgi:4-amino-4-deoxy-L-arabinose transferase-like glycosyltransferase